MDGKNEKIPTSKRSTTLLLEQTLISGLSKLRNVVGNSVVDRLRTVRTIGDSVRGKTDGYIRSGDQVHDCLRVKRATDVLFNTSEGFCNAVGAASTHMERKNVSCIN